MTLGGAPAEGVPLIDLKLSVDSRTNSLIIAGSRNDLEVIEAIISRLEDADVETRHNQVYKLKNAQAADVATALQNFLTRSLQVLATGQQLTAFQEIERDVVIVPEPISNTLLISATPRWYAELVRMIQELDAQPPQVVIQVMIAEVNLNDSEEFGVEVGLQSPVLFARSVIPAPGQGGTVSYTQNANGLGLVPAGVTVNNTINPAALPGFNFNSTGPLGNNPVVGPAIVGFQGLQNLGVNRFSPRNQNVGGLVFSAASDTFSLLIRALKIQQRLDILSRPQITTLDNQAASILIGQAFPYSTGTNVTGTGIITNNVSYRNIGVQLDVTPRITPDGRVIMRVTPQISSAVAGTIALGNGVNAQIFNVQTVDTTVVAQDGETVAIGGLISKINDDRFNKIPWLGDLPKLGALFRYHDRGTQRRELLVIMTPHIIRCPADADRVLAEESRRIDWIVGDIVKMHGTTGLEPILGPPPPGAPESPNRLWFSKEPANLPPALPNASEEMLPPPTQLPPAPGETDRKSVV
jgi:type II secretion system protein D